MYSSASLLLDDFDAPPAPPAPEPAPDPEVILPTHPEEALRAARAEGFAEGQRTAQEAAARARAGDVSAALAGIAARLDDAAAQAAAVADASAEAMMKLIVAVIAAGYPSLRERYGGQEVVRLARRLLPTLEREPRVVVHVNPAQAAEVAAELAGEDRVTVAPTASVPPGDARIAWQDGGAVRDAAAAWSAITDILGPLGLLPDTAQAAAAADP